MREEDWPPCSEQGELRDDLNGEACERDSLVNRRFGNIHVLQEVVKLFLSESPERLNDIRRNISRKDAAALHIAAEALHDAVSQFGPNPAADIAAKLESLGDQGDWAGAEEAYRRLDKAIHQLQPVIAALAIEPPP